MSANTDESAAAAAAAAAIAAHYGQAEALKAEGNAYFQKGNLDSAIASYQSSLKVLDKVKIGGNKSNKASSLSNDIDPLLRPTVLSNLGLVYLKRGGDGKDDAEACIRACTDAIDCLDSSVSSSSSVGEHVDVGDRRAKLRSKVLYRRARARVTLTSSTIDDKNDETTNSSLNAAARDLLDVLKIDPDNKEAAKLLVAVRERHGQGKKDGGSDMARALAGLALSSSSSSTQSSSTTSQDAATPTTTSTDQTDTLDHNLKIIMGLLARDVASASMELGRRGGVSVLMDVAKGRRREVTIRLGVLALHALSAACSHGPFVRRYACPNSLSQENLTHIISEACGAAATTTTATATTAAAAAATDEAGRPQEVAVAAIALFLRLVVHLDHTDEKMVQSVQDVDGPSVCRAIIAGLSAPPSGEDASTTCHRASIVLLSAWTANDMDSIASAAEASDVYLESATKTKSNRLTEAQMNTLKPKEFAKYKKKMYEIHKRNAERARENSMLFCDAETGGLDALLDCAVSTRDHTLRREIGNAIGRLTACFEDDEALMKLVSSPLGYSGSIAPSSEDSKENETLTIEEIKEGDEEDEEDGKRDDSEPRASGGLNLAMKRGQLVASLLLGKSDVGVWALQSGWDDGNGVARLQSLISSENQIATSIASEILSAAASVEKGRPLLTPIVENGGIEDLIASDNREVRSGAASALAKLGLASKDLASDEGEVFGLMQIAAELIEASTEDEKALMEKTSKIRRGDGSHLSSASTAIDRGIEVLSYLTSKTSVKEEIAHGFKVQSSSGSVLETLIELASTPEAGESQMAYGLASIFSSIAVSNKTLRKEAFDKSEITPEQYDQLQSLKTEEEKELGKTQEDPDPWEAVSARIVRMANANVPRSMVKLMSGSSETTKEMLVTGMNRMAVEQSVRGLMIQQGCLSACLKVENKSESSSETEKKTWNQARHCVAKLLVTTNPGLLTVSQRLGSIGPLIQLIHDHESTDLSRFEALMAITNLASLDEETKNRVVAEKGIARLSYAMFSEHGQVRQAATEAMSNLIPHPEMLKYLAEAENMRLWVAFARDFDENFECSRASTGCLAMASQDPKVAETLANAAHFNEMARSLLECGNLELMHRILVALLNMSDHGGKSKEAVVASGSQAFCKAYVQSYHDGSMASELKFTEEQKGLMAVTVDLASQLCE